MVNVMKIGLEEYLRVTGKDVNDYNLVGVNHNGSMQSSGTPEHIEKMLKKKIPQGTEVVVGYHDCIYPTSARCLYTVSGIALVPKKEKDWTDNVKMSRTDMEE